MSNDLIRRSDAIKMLQEAIMAYPPVMKGCGETRDSTLEEAIDLILDIPSADRPRGEWIDEADKIDASFGIHDYRCSNCNSYADEYIGGHEWYTAGKPNFCPYCGADMRERESE